MPGYGQSTSECPDADLRKALQLWVLSYNASHSTLLARVIAKKQKRDLTVTGAQSGVLYVSGLPVEKNILAGLERKIRTFADAFELTVGSRSTVTVTCGSSTLLSTLPDDSVDYIFTDPPFGAYIPYAEINQINEAWMGRFTDSTAEAIISPAQGKTVSHYAELLAAAFAEASRVLTSDGRATVVFHASKPEVWNALGDALAANGLAIDATTVLDKRQASFKQLVSEGGTRHDAVFLLSPMTTSLGQQMASSSRGVAADHEPQSTPSSDVLVSDRLVAQRMWSRYAARRLQTGSRVTLGASELLWPHQKEPLSSGLASPATG